jgi:hypothetical protein
MKTLSDGIYTVSSFFGAVHAILYRCIPPDRPLREYLYLFILLTALLKRALWRSYLAIESNPKAALLVCLSPEVGLRESKAIVGFSACGPRRTRDHIIHDRKERLPILKKIATPNLPWPVGNCAEAETFAHLRLLEDYFPVIRTGPQMIAVSLAVDLKDLDPVQPCDQCKALFYNVRSQFIVTANLAPFEIARTS